MTNMIFMPFNFKVIEIKTNNPNPNSYCYWHQAESLDLDYTLFIAESTEENNIIEGKGCNVKVDINSLLTLISNLEINYDLYD